jgi:Ni/Co efflux regulator RcnB
MRKFLVSLLLASAAASPAIAGPRDHSDDSQQTHENRQQAHEERQQAHDEARAERSAPTFAPQARMQRQPEQFAGRPQFNGGERLQQQVDMNAMRAQQQVRMQQIQQQQRGEDIEQVQQRFEQRQRDVREGGGDFRQSDRQFPQVMRDRHPLVVSETPQRGTQPPLRAESRVRWNRDWRNDNHYDWRRFRDHHRSRFHLGIFIDPFGWGYQPFDVGYRLWPAYYGNQYWIDPAEYGLPYPPPGAEWVRYYNDALLVDMYSGTVIDVIPGFFW